MHQKEIEIILVEDNPDDAALAIRAFTKNNVCNNMIHLRNGEEAIQFFFEQAEFEGKKFTDNPKVVLLDLKMPKVNGMEVLARLKKEVSTKTIPVVVLTSSAEDPDIKECYELGANSYIVKPVEFDNFVKTVVDLGMYWSLLNHTPSG